MSQCNPHANWAQLSHELWGAIFARLNPDVGDDDFLSSRIYQIGRLDQACFHHLPRLHLVCKSFNHILARAPHAHDLLTLTNMHAHDLPSMCAYIQKNGSSISRIVANCGSPYVEAALVTLLSHKSGPAQLTSAHLGASKFQVCQRLHNSVLILLTQFSSLTACTFCLDTPNVLNEFDLNTLSVLPHLVRLELQRGQFRALDALSHLTHLSLDESYVSCSDDCDFVTSLVNLHLMSSSLEDLHSQGVCACHHLRELQCSRSAVLGSGSDADSMQFIRGDAHCVPDSLRLLTSLTQLDFYIDNSDRHVDFDWLGNS